MIIKGIIIQGVHAPENEWISYFAGIAFCGGVGMFISTIFGRKENKKKRDLIGLAFYL